MRFLDIVSAILVSFKLLGFGDNISIIECFYPLFLSLMVTVFEVYIRTKDKDDEDDEDVEEEIEDDDDEDE